jgi:hypothetical protein
MKATRRHFLATSAALAAASPLAGWSQNMAKLTMQAAWVNDAEFMGYFIAMDKGFYKAEGLDLTYLSGGPDVIPEASLLSKKADVCLTTVETAIKAITDQKAPLVIIGAQYQKNPVGIVSLASKPLKTPADLVGKTIAVPPVNRLTVEAMLKLNGIDHHAGLDRRQVVGHQQRAATNAHIDHPQLKIDARHRGMRKARHGLAAQQRTHTEAIAALEAEHLGGKATSDRRARAVAHQHHVVHVELHLDAFEVAHHHRFAGFDQTLQLR